MIIIARHMAIPFKYFILNTPSFFVVARNYRTGFEIQLNRCASFESFDVKFVNHEAVPNKPIEGLKLCTMGNVLVSGITKARWNAIPAGLENFRIECGLQDCLFVQFFGFQLSHEFNAHPVGRVANNPPTHLSQGNVSADTRQNVGFY